MYSARCQVGAMAALLSALSAELTKKTIRQVPSLPSDLAKHWHCSLRGLIGAENGQGQQVAQHDAGDSSCSGGRARRREAAVEDVFMATWMGELMDNSPTALLVVVMIAGARFHARTARTASQDSSRAHGLGGQEP